MIILLVLLFDKIVLVVCLIGHMFHIDFGFILGRDPKPMPPPMKLTKEMVDAMGGPGSEQYKMFTDLCFSAFFHLRRFANYCNLCSMLCYDTEF